jgi:hypothetical protein
VTVGSKRLYDDPDNTDHDSEENGFHAVILAKQRRDDEEIGSEAIMTAPHSITAEAVIDRFIDTIRRMVTPPELSLMSVLPAAAPGQLQIKSSDKYGSLPDCCVAGDTETEILEATSEAARINHAIARIRQDIQDYLPGARFLLPVSSSDGQILAGVLGGAGKGLIVTAGATALEAYQVLREKLNLRSSRMRIVELMVATLGGLQRLGFDLRGSTSLMEQAGVTTQAIVEAARLRLQDAGVSTVLTEHELCGVPGCPILGVSLDVCRAVENLFAISSRVELWQLVALAREAKSITYAMTWGTPGAIAVVDEACLKGAVLEQVLKQVDLFIDSCRLADEMEKGTGRG